MKKILFQTFFFLPSVVLAQATLSTLASSVIGVLNALVMLIIGMAVFVFIVGVIRFVISAGDDKTRSDGKQMIIWGTISIFVMVAVWGLVEIIRTTFFG